MEPQCDERKKLMPKFKTLGELAYFHYYHNLGMDRRRWESLRDIERKGWETVAREVGRAVEIMLHREETNDD